MKIKDFYALIFLLFIFFIIGCNKSKDVTPVVNLVNTNKQKIDFSIKNDSLVFIFKRISKNDIYTINFDLNGNKAVDKDLAFGFNFGLFGTSKPQLCVASLQANFIPICGTATSNATIKVDNELVIYSIPRLEIVNAALNGNIYFNFLIYDSVLKTNNLVPQNVQSNKIDFNFVFTQKI
jgi:hypothetical protein